MRQHILTVVIALLAGFAGAFAYALVGEPLHLPGSDYFSDVSADSPHSEDIGFAVEAGITMGVTPDLYGSGLPVSREQMASFQMRDLAMAMVLAVEVSRCLDQFQRLSPLTVEERIDVLRWGAELLEYENESRPAEAVGGTNAYTAMAEQFRDLAWIYENTDW